MLYVGVANPGREGRNRDNSWLQFNGFIQTNRGTASPTQPQCVGGNYSPANALKPRNLTYINYSSTVSHYIYIFTSPCSYHSSENITYDISHKSTFRSHITNTSTLVKSAGLTDSAAILPSPPRPNRADRPTNQRARLPSPGRIMRMSEPISGLILVRMST